MRTTLLGLAVLGLALAGCNDAGQTEIARGNAFASRRQFDEAIKAYQAAAQAQPHKARPRELLGHVLFDLKRYPEARAAYQDAVAVESDGALEARIGLARIDAEDGHLDAAIDTLTDVLKRNPSNLYAWLSRANLFIRRAGPQDAELAINDAEKAKAIGRTNPSVLYTAGSAYLAAKRFDEADKAFAELPADSPLGAYGKARVASAKNDKIGALSNLRDARQRSGTSPEGWKPEEVKADPAFRALKDDPEFLKVVEG